MKYSEIKAQRAAAGKGKAAGQVASSARVLTPGSSPVKLITVDPGDPTEQAPLVISLYGHQNAGKSRFIGTAPGPIGVIPLENKTKPAVLKAAAEFGKQVVVPEINLIRVENPMRIAAMPPACISEDDYKGFKNPGAAVNRALLARSAEFGYDSDAPDCCHMHYYRWHATRTKSDAFRMVEMGVRTLAIDTFGQMVEDMLFANYGRIDNIMPLEKKSFNQEVREFMSAISHINLILTHHSGEIWKDNKPTNKTKPASTFKKLGHFTGATVELLRADQKTKGEWMWKLAMRDCTANPALIGKDLLTDDNITFQNLSLMVFPDSDEIAWEKDWSVLFLDRREKGIEAELRKQDLDVTVAHLEFGDMMWNGRGPVALDLGDCMVACERKRLSDLINSMKKRRLSGHQLRGLWDGYDFVFLICEGMWRPGSGGEIEHWVDRWEYNWKSKKRVKVVGWRPYYNESDRYSVSYRQLAAFLHSLSLRSMSQTGGPLRGFRTASPRETAMQVAALYKGFQAAWESHHAHDQIYTEISVPKKGHGTGWGKPHTHDQAYEPTRGRRIGLIQEPPTTCWRMAAQLPGVDRMGQAIREHFRTARAAANATVADYMAIPGIGRVKAEAIVRAWTVDGA